MDLTEKNLQAIRTVTGKSADDADLVLQGFCPGILLGPDVEQGTLAFSAARLLIGLLARLYPTIVLAGPASVIQLLFEEATRINPAIQTSTEASLWLALGRIETVPADATAIHLGTAGWQAVVSKEPVSFRPGSSVLAALVSACLGAWETFRYAAARAGIGPRWVAATYGWNLLTHIIGPVKDTDDVPTTWHDPTRVPDTVLIGAGALGHGFAYGLRELDQTSGRLKVVDNRPILDDTRQRYACQYHGDRGSKADILRDLLASTALEVAAVNKDFIQYVNEDDPECRIDVAIAAVDREDTRVRIQATLPRVIINGWTGQGSMGLSVHRFATESACLACMYATTNAGQFNEEAMIFEGLRGAIPLDRIRRMLASNRPLSITDTQALADKGFPRSSVSSYLGKSVQSAYQGLVCSGLILQRPGQAPVDVPLAFVSALVGILQALELVKLSVPALQPFVLNGRLQFHVLRRPDCVFAPLAQRRDCFCRDPVYVHAYNEKWG